MPNIIDSYSEANYDVSFTLNATFLAIGQATTGNGTTVGSAVFYLAKVNAPVGTATAKIYAHSGTFGTSSVPTGTALATSDNFTVASLTTSLQLATFTFSGVNQITLTNGTHYVVSVEYIGNGVDNLNVGSDSTSPTHAGILTRNSSGSWSAQTGFDAIFYLYDNSVAPSDINFVKASTVMVMR